MAGNWLIGTGEELLREAEVHPEVVEQQEEVRWTLWTFPKIFERKKIVKKRKNGQFFHFEATANFFAELNFPHSHINFRISALI
jgi:hypothetical protein